MAFLVSPMHVKTQPCAGKFVRRSICSIVLLALGAALVGPLFASHSFRDEQDDVVQRGPKPDLHVIIASDDAGMKASMEYLKSAALTMDMSVSFSVLSRKGCLDLHGSIGFACVGIQSPFWVQHAKMPGRNTTHIALVTHHDSLHGIHLPSMMQTMKTFKLDMAAASLVYPMELSSMKQDRCCLLRRSNQSELHFGIFTAPAFHCFLQFANMTKRFELDFATHCKASMAVLDNQVLHVSGSDHARYFTATGTGIQTCQGLPTLNLHDPGYFETVTHRGGWRTIMEYGVKYGLVSVNGLRRSRALGKLLQQEEHEKECQNQLELVDCSEKQFIFEPEPVLKPWLGITHYSYNLRDHFPRRFTLMGLLESDHFNKSLPYCKGLIVLTKYVGTWLRKRLPSIPVYVLKHPIGIAGKVPTFNLQTFEQNTHTKVVFIGSQFRRLSTIALARVPYPKLWLHGRGKDMSMERYQELYRSEDADAPWPIPTTLDFELISTNSSEDFDKLVLTNICVVDLLDASANNAVLEAISMNNPIFVSRLAPVEEYLGKHYPLYFDSLRQLERMLGTSHSSVLNLLVRGNMYLRNMKKDDIMLESFWQKLEKTANELVPA